MGAHSLDEPEGSTIVAPTGAPRRRRKPGENRARLIQAGMREFGSRGYHGASTSSIGALAGVPQPHVYANFRTKLELYLACIDEVVSTLSADHAGMSRSDREFVGPGSARENYAPKDSSLGQNEASAQALAPLTGDYDARAFLIQLFSMRWDADLWESIAPRIRLLEEEMGRGTLVRLSETYITEIVNDASGFTSRDPGDISDTTSLDQDRGS